MDADGDDSAKHQRPHRPFVPHFIRIFAVPIVIGWVALTVLVNVAVPTLEVVGEQHSAPMAPLDAPSMKAMLCPLRTSIPSPTISRGRAGAMKLVLISSDGTT